MKTSFNIPVYKWLAAVLTACLAVFCLCGGWPYLVHQSSVNFFAYTREFAGAFFNRHALAQGYVAGWGIESNTLLWGGASPDTFAPRVSEFLWRFIAQFYLNTPLIILTALWTIALFCILTWRVCGIYTLLVCLLFFFFFFNPEPIHAAVSVSLLLNVSALNIVLHRVKKGRSVWLTAAVLQAVLLYACGWWALWFTGAALYSAAVAARINPSRKNVIDLVASVVLAGCVCWLMRRYAGYAPAWYYGAPFYIALGLCVIGLLAGIPSVLRANLNGDGAEKAGLKILKTALVAAMFATAAVFQAGAERNADNRTVIKARNAAFKGQYGKVYEMCHDYYQNRQNLENPTAQEALQRHEMSAWFKLSMLQTSLANRIFLNYGNFYETNLLYPRPFADLYACGFAYAGLYDILEIYPPQVPCLFTLFEKAGWQNRYLEMMLKALWNTGQYRLYEKTAGVCQKSLYGRKVLKRVSRTLKTRTDSLQEDGAVPVPLNHPGLVRAGECLDQWVTLVFEQKVFGGRMDTMPGAFGPHVVTFDSTGFGRQYRPENFSEDWHSQCYEKGGVALPLLDYYVLERLLDRRWDILPLLISVYRECGEKVLPRYVQEAWCLASGYQNASQRAEFLGKPIAGYTVSEEVLQHMESFTEDLRLFNLDVIPASEMRKKYEGTYAYFFFFEKIQ